MENTEHSNNFCRACGKELILKEYGRKKQYCNSSCRSLVWHRDHSEARILRQIGLTKKKIQHNLPEKDKSPMVDTASSPMRILKALRSFEK